MDFCGDQIGNDAVRVTALSDDIALEYDDSVILTFTPNDPDLISTVEAAGEYIRDTATVNIRDNDCKSNLRVYKHYLLLSLFTVQCYS